MLSTLDLFTIGIGPSSSHSVGPMRAAGLFTQRLRSQGHAGQNSRLARVVVELYGSLALTGRGHGTDTSLVLGLAGESPATVDPDAVPDMLSVVRESGRLPVRLPGRGTLVATIDFDAERDFEFHKKETLPRHTNGMRFLALDAAGERLLVESFYSIGGGFVIESDGSSAVVEKSDDELPHPFASADDLVGHAEALGGSISDVMFANEAAWRPEAETRSELRRRWQAMQDCIERGCTREGILPGGLKVERRAAALRRTLQSRPVEGLADPLTILDWVNLWALAVNEENAAGGRVVTAPTNGAAGILPAVLHYAARFCGASRQRTASGDFADDCAARFLLTAAAIGLLYKRNASISGAEVGCQGEVGVACSMAAGALTEILGGTPRQVEMAAEIGMEHNLGLTCDPIGGLVQVPCIERNAMGAVKAINASRLALCSDGNHRVSLDRVIETMRRTGRDMSTKYKETARGGLAITGLPITDRPDYEQPTPTVNVTEC